MNLLKFTFVYVLIFFSRVVGTHSEEYKSYKDYKLFLVEAGYERVKKLLCNKKESDKEDFIYKGNRTATEVLVSPDLECAFREITIINNLETRLLFEDYSRLIKEEKIRPRSVTSKLSWTTYYDVDEIFKYIGNVSKTYGFTELIIGGRSYEGRLIFGLRIHTVPPPRTTKPVIFIESGIYGSDWITIATTTYFINKLLTSSDPEIEDLRESFDWRIFPTVNPDGYHYSWKYDRMWRKTRSKSPNGCRGVDANRNWDYNWLDNGTSSNLCDTNYAGTKPFSEKETSTLAFYIKSLVNLQAYIAFHSDKEFVLIPYSDSVKHHDNYDDLVQIGKRSIDYGHQVYGEKAYGGPGTAAEFFYSSSGTSMDWVRQELGTPIVFSYELRGYHFFWPPERIVEQGEEVTAMMLGLVLEARQLKYFNSTDDYDD